jgi:hypothetical protein
MRSLVLNDQLRLRLAASVAIAAVLLHSDLARANDASGYAIILIFGALTVVGVIGLVAISACRRIVDPMRRALTRFAIAAVLFTPVPVVEYAGRVKFWPALAPLLAQLFSTHGASHQDFGWLEHPLLISYAVVFVLFTPLVVAWTRIEASYGRG